MYLSILHIRIYMYVFKMISSRKSDYCNWIFSQLCGNTVNLWATTAQHRPYRPRRQLCTCAGTLGRCRNSHWKFNQRQVHLVVNELVRELKEEINLPDTANTQTSEAWKKHLPRTTRITHLQTSFHCRCHLHRTKFNLNVLGATGGILGAILKIACKIFPKLYSQNVQRRNFLFPKCPLLLCVRTHMCVHVCACVSVCIEGLVPLLPLFHLS